MTPGPPPSGATATPAPLDAAIELLAKGDAQAALRMASQACHAAPGDERTHYTYGQAWVALGEHPHAERAFAEAIRLSPAWAEAWVEYGLARYRQGAVGDAKLAMRQALLHAPGHVAATVNLGSFMRLTGEAEGAEALLRNMAAQMPETAGLRLGLVADLLQSGRMGEVLELLSGPAPPEPAAARHWHLQRCLALIELGHIADAKAALAATEALGPIPAETAPLWRWRRVLIARAEGAGALMREEAVFMAAALEAMGPRAVPEHRIMGHYDLAKLYSTWKADAEAMAHWTAGHALLRASQPFSRARHAATIDATIQAFATERLRQGPRASNRDLTPVFIVGMPRSGTTLCEQILGAHPQAFGAGERNALADMAAALGGADPVAAPGRIAALGAATLDRAALAYLAALNALAPGQGRVIDKMPGNYLHLGLAALMLPGARVIHCTRDPRDIGLSIFTFRFYGHHPYAHDLGDLGWAISEQIRLMEHFKAALPDRITTVRLDDWVTDFDGTLTRVLGHVGLPFDPACARFYEQESRVRTVSWEQVRKPVNSSGLGRWRRYQMHLQPLITELASAGALVDWNA